MGSLHLLSTRPNASVPSLQQHGVTPHFAWRCYSPHHGHCGAPPRSPLSEPGHKSSQLLGMLPAASSLLSPSPGNFFLQRESSHPSLLSLPGRKPAPNDIVQRRISPVLILDLSEGPSPLQSSCGTTFQFSSPFCQILHRYCSWGHSLINFWLPKSPSPTQRTIPLWDRELTEDELSNSLYPPSSYILLHLPGTQHSAEQTSDGWDVDDDLHKNWTRTIYFPLPLDPK